MGRTDKQITCDTKWDSLSNFDRNTVPFEVTRFGERST